MQTHHQQTDAALINLFREGDGSAMEALILRHKDKVYTAIYLLLRDRNLAEDIFQDCFLKVIKAMKETDENYAEQGRFLPWVLRVARNLCIDHFRRVKVRMPVTLSDGSDLEDMLWAGPETAATAMEQRETCKQVREVIERLPAEQKEVVNLRVYGELSFKEIADLTGVSINTALGRMRYALLNMRRMLGKEELSMR